MTKTAKPDQIDPLEILREEVRAAALCHGVERCDELAAKLVERYAQRLGGGSIYVKRLRSSERKRVSEEIFRRHNGSKTVSRRESLTTRPVKFSELLRSITT